MRIWSYATVATTLSLTAAFVSQPTVETNRSSYNSPQPDQVATTFAVDADSFSQIQVGQQIQLENIALNEDESVDLNLQRFEVLTPDAQLLVAGADGERPLAQPEVTLLSGTVAGEPDSSVFLGVSSYGGYGFIQRAGSLRMISSGPAADNDAITLTVADVSDLPEPNPDHPLCGVAPDPGAILPSGFPEANAGPPTGGPPCRVATVAIDTDWEFTADIFNGDADASAAYAITLLAAVSEIYQDAINVRLLVSYLRVWESNTDPYTDFSDNLLDQFLNHWNTEQDDVDREVAHLLSGRDDLPYGGIAYVGVVCFNPNGYGVSGHLNGTFPYPLQDNNDANWDLVVVSHELGHNFGTYHTHDGYEPPIDNCGNGDCSEAPDGTIMSYCHTCPGGLTNIALNFHPLVEGVMLDFLDDIGCDLTAEGADAVDDLAVTYEGGSTIVDVLLNDLTASCEPDEVAIDTFDASTPAGGTVELVAPNEQIQRERLSYTAPTDFAGEDSFSYTLVNGATANVSIDVDPLREPDVTGPTAPGSQVSYYALNEPSQLPNFDALNPVSDDVIADAIDFASTGGAFATSGLANEIGAVFEGFVTVPADGLYTFYTESDDGSALFIGDQLVVNNDGLHGMLEQSGSIALAAGPHAIRVEFFENFGGAGLIVSFAGPNLTKQVIPGSAWSYSTGCSGDFNGDLTINGADLGVLLGEWNNPDSLADLNQDGTVNGADLGVLLGAWGGCG